MNALLSRLKALVLLIAGTVLLTGCEFSVYEMPLPGGTDVGDKPITVDVMFDDVLDLVPKSTVKVNDVSVGSVSTVELEGQVARVGLELQEDVELPDNAVAQIRQTSLLGEKFVSLSPPTSEPPSDELLESGDVIPLERSGRNPEVEEVLGALSLLLNGGGVGQLQTITRELNLALEGREDSVRSAFRQIEELMGQLDENKFAIVDAIESLNRLAVSAKEQIPTIDATLEQLPSALRTIDAQRADLVKMLEALNRLGDVGVRVIEASKDSTIASFRQLVPVLTELANSGDNFAKAFHVFLTYPFVDEVVGRDPQVARNLHMGDYTNLSVKLDIALPGQEGGGPDLPDPPDVPTVVCTTLGELPNNTPLDDLPEDLCRSAIRAINECIRNPSPRNCEGVPRAIVREVARALCADRPNNPLCDLFPGLPAPGDGDGDGGGVPEVPEIPGLPGAPRAGYGPTDTWSARGPTMSDLMKSYDPALVALLVPGMVTR